MKVGILTFHFVNNFGGALQAYALKQACEECGAEAHVVDYRQWFIRFTDMVRMFPIAKNPKVIASGLRTMHLRIGRRRKFSAFQKKHLGLSKTYYTSRELASNPPGYDKYICGSDQIWNSFITFGVSTPYYAAFEKDSKNKFSYAPSFGDSSISAKYIPQVKKLIGDLGDVSVREVEGIDIVRKLTGKEAVQLIDPTFLVDAKNWEELADTAQIDIPYDEYILVYIMQQDEAVYEYASRLKGKYNLPIIEIGRYGYKAHFVDKCLVNLGPLEFIKLFKNATHVCTNSYHGVIFSIIFGKKICIIPCKRFKSRIDSLLKLFNIELKEDIGNLDLDTKYDRDVVSKVIAEEKAKSFAYIRKNLGV